VRHLLWIQRARLIRCKYGTEGYFSAISIHTEVLGRHEVTAKTKKWDTAGKWTYGSGKIERTGAWWLETTATVEEVDSSISQ
jgi:hypothetical protein